MEDINGILAPTYWIAVLITTAVIEILKSFIWPKLTILFSSISKKFRNNLQEKNRQREEFIIELSTNAAMFKLHQLRYQQTQYWSLAFMILQSSFMGMAVLLDQKGDLSDLLRITILGMQLFITTGIVSNVTNTIKLRAQLKDVYLVMIDNHRDS